MIYMLYASHIILLNKHVLRKNPKTIFFLLCSSLDLLYQSLTLLDIQYIIYRFAHEAVIIFEEPYIDFGTG